MEPPVGKKKDFFFLYYYFGRPKEITQASVTASKLQLDLPCQARGPGGTAGACLEGSSVPLAAPVEKVSAGLVIVLSETRRLLLLPAPRSSACKSPAAARDHAPCPGAHKEQPPRLHAGEGGAGSPRSAGQGPSPRPRARPGEGNGSEKPPGYGGSWCVGACRVCHVSGAPPLPFLHS